MKSLIFILGFCLYFLNNGFSQKVYESDRFQNSTWNRYITGWLFGPTNFLDTKIIYQNMNFQFMPRNRNFQVVRTLEESTGVDGSKDIVYELMDKNNKIEMGIMLPQI